VVSGASGHELGDFARGEQLWLTREASGQHDLGKVFHDFHAIKSSEEIRPAGNRAMIGKEKSVVMRNERFKDGAEIGGAGRGVTHQRNLPEADNDFGKQRLIKALASGGEAGGGGGMGVANRVNIWPHLVEEQMHARFGGNLAIAAEMTTLHIHDDEIAGSHHALVEASGGGKNVIGIEANGQVPFAGNDVAALIEPATNETNVAAMLLFRTIAKLC
jgi:hypothetical protein